MGLRTHASFFTAGSAGRTTGRNDQCVVMAATSSDGAAAPASIHALRTATWAASSGAPMGGMGLTPSAAVTARMMRLLVESPGTTAGPDSPPLRAGGGVEAEAVAALVGAVALDAVLRRIGFTSRV